MQQRPNIGLALAGLCLLAALGSLPAASEARAVESELLKAERLHHLVELIRVGGRPSVRDVLEAYKEYVGLYELQSELTDRFQKLGASSSVENEYEQISAILSDEGVHQISESLFSALSAADQPADRLELTDRLRAQIERSIEALQH